MTSVAVGIHVWEPEPLLVAATMARLRAHTSMATVETHVIETPSGGAAAFNQLAAAAPQADVIVLLENGAYVGPAWLERLLAALDADPRNGLAGPSTNRSWNEQAVFPKASESDGDVARAALEAHRRFGDRWRTLEPLYSLADFCYAVRRQVRDTIGEADEGYGTGPCWEMDYNVRAARAGYRGVWACGAFVYRSPCTTSRGREEGARFEASKRRYQDKFCGLRLSGERRGPMYETHCRGDACPHFAPSALIDIHRARRTDAADVVVSCVMPTRDRVEFALQAVRYYLRQDVSASELIILDDGRADLERDLPDDPRIRYVRMSPGRSIGEKRNHGCALARGRYIAQWDDDDWYGPSRLSAQLAPLLAGAATICGLMADAILSLPDWRFWRCSPELHRRLFVHDVHGGTLVYDRRIWIDGARYAQTSLAEDAWFLREAMRRGARLARLSRPDQFIYVRHARNSWRFDCGVHINPRGWIAQPEPPALASDRSFYVSRRSQPRGCDVVRNGDFAVSI